MSNTRPGWKTLVSLWSMAIGGALALTMIGGTWSPPHLNAADLPAPAHASGSFAHAAPIGAAPMLAGSYAQTTEEEADWTGSRYRCVICHSAPHHNVVMPHPIGPDCTTCHSGTTATIGCPSCHSMHSIDYPHKTYATCNECHAGPEVEQVEVRETAVGFAAYLFRNPDFFLWDTSALE